MYICISTLKKLRAGEIVVLEKEADFAEISARVIGGDIVGFALKNQIEGCISFGEALANISKKRIVTQVALITDNTAILYSESTALFSTIKNKESFSFATA